MLKRILCIIFICASLLLSACNDTHKSYSDLNGDRHSFANTNGDWTVLNYWASWCKGCIEEIPDLNAMAADYHGKHIQVIGVNFDNLSLHDLEQAVKKAGIQFPVLREDPRQDLGLQSIDVLPATFIIDPRGQVVKTLLGPSTEYRIIQAIREAGNG